MYIIKQIKNGGFKFIAKQIFGAWQDIIDIEKKFNLIDFFHILRIRILLTLADHETAIKSATRLHKKGSLTALLYIATSNILTGNTEEAEYNIRKLLKQRPYCLEASCLLCGILAKKGETQKAINLLQDTIKFTSYMKPWIMWSNLIEDENSLNQYRLAIIEAQQSKKISNNQIVLTKCLANAALRSKQYDILVEILGQSQAIYKKQTFRQRLTAWSSDNFPAAFGQQALEHVDDVLSKHSIEYFLISGTLLGCIREGALLPHDRDLDIGVWLDDGIDKIKTILITSGFFHLVETRSEELLKLRHVTGIAIDIFFHKRTHDEVTHSGVKTVWHNYLFKLKDIKFLGRTYLIPDDPDRYLTENYGDWRTPKIEFDCALDTPNAVVYNQMEMNVYAQLKILMGNNRSSEYRQLISEDFLTETKKFWQNTKD